MAGRSIYIISLITIVIILVGCGASMQEKELYEIISDRTGQTYDRVYKDGDRDYWMSAVDAKKYGMIDEIVSKRK